MDATFSLEQRRWHSRYQYYVNCWASCGRAKR